MRCRDNSSPEYSGTLPSYESDMGPSILQCKVNRVSIMAGEEQPRIRLDQFYLGADIAFGTTRGPGGQPGTTVVTRVQRQSIGLKTDVDFPTDQLTVIGKSSLGQGGDAIFVVLSARVMD